MCIDVVFKTFLLRDLLQTANISRQKLSNYPKNAHHCLFLLFFLTNTIKYEKVWSNFIYFFL